VFAELALLFVCWADVCCGLVGEVEPDQLIMETM